MCLTLGVLRICAALVAAAGAPPSVRVQAFYYPWYGNPETDGAWRQWNHEVNLREGGGKNHVPPEDIGSNFYPALGLYSANDAGDVETQMRQLGDAGVGVVVSSWWGRGDFTDRAVPGLLDAAAKFGLRVAFHIEPFPGRNAVTTRESIVYLTDTYGKHPAFYRDTSRGNRPIFYIYDSYLVPAAEWATILSPTGAATLRGTPCDAVAIGLYVKQGDERFLREGGFDGFYTYFATDGFTYGSTVANWPALADIARTQGLLFIPSVGPGYDDTRIRPWNGGNQRGRENGAYFDRMWSAALGVRPETVSVTSFNEWHEGTQIEPAVPKTTPDYAYLDYAPQSPEFYLERTRYWANQVGGAQLEERGVTVGVMRENRRDDDRIERPREALPDRPDRGLRPRR